jgi:ATP-dependent helicase/nuclease subunit A
MVSNVIELNVLERIRRETNENQTRATSANHSAWVSANAGAGKTYVLVRRVLGLLLAGSRPEAILCLTFTKAAAAEMANRLIAELGQWSIAPEAELSENIERLSGRPPSASDIELARRLFAQVIETPGGLKIMTIHAFCDSVLRRFPLEAGVSPNFSILSDEDAAALREEAAEVILSDAADQPQSALGQALLKVIAYANEDQFDGLIRTVLANREDFRVLLQQQDYKDPFTGIDRTLRRTLGLGADQHRETLIDAQRALCGQEALAEAIATLEGGKATDQDLARKLAKARAATTPSAVTEALAEAFLTKEREARSDRFITKAIRDRRPDLAAWLEKSRDAFAALDASLRAVTAVEATSALLRLADAILSRFEAAKAARSSLDYDDLIAKTVSLLTFDGGAGWVLYRLDEGVDHLLVDEAQDTSPTQWQVITRLTDEFFSGEGARETTRTIFAVGDEKQSIYSFQGAEPKRFAEMGRRFRTQSESVGRSYHETPLLLSFRSSDPILRAVDLVFSDPARTPGLNSTPQGVRHYAHRNGHAGLVEVWPTETQEKEETCNAWTPLDEFRNQGKPYDRLANRIADQIKAWLDAKELLLSRNRPIRPGDILILVKKREPFARPMIRALKERGVPVAGADRMRLTAELAVQDLMSIGDFVLLPEDDLNLACLLKSPAFDFSDDDLFQIAHDREGSLWQALCSKAKEIPLFAQAVQALRIWRKQADQSPPFEFYVERLEHEGLHDALLSRLGAEAADAISEFLELALAYEQHDIPSLQGFLQWLRQNNIEIKRDMDQGRDETRVMTVHGAKGLEANIVFLADTCSTKSGDRSPLLVFEPDNARPGAAKQFLWTPAGGYAKIAAAQNAREKAKKSDREEYHRLLYVAMTRARDRLYVSGFEGIRQRDPGCWYDLIRSGLDGAAIEGLDGTLRLETVQTAPCQTSDELLSPPPISSPPAWINTPMRPESAPAQPIAATSWGKAARQEAPERTEALERGAIIHKLLELLPTVPQASWEARARQFLTTFGSVFPVKERKTIIAATLNILNAPEFSPLWGPQSRAEVELTAEFPPRKPGASPLRLSGKVDRLVVLNDTVCIVDYKTTQTTPQRPDDAPRAHLLQLAAYHAAIKAIFPDKAVRSALLWTSTPELMEIPEALLTALSPEWEEAAPNTTIS